MNVIEPYKNMATEEIKKELAKNYANFAVLAENITGDLNIGIILRLCNVFGVEDMYFLGQKEWDRRTAVGTQNYTGMTRIRTVKELKDIASDCDITLIGVENIEGAVDIENFLEEEERWIEVQQFAPYIGHPRKPEYLLIFGEEDRGISKEVLELCNAVISIKQFGSVRSLNVSSAAAIVLYRFRQFYDKWKGPCYWT